MTTGMSRRTFVKAAALIAICLPTHAEGTASVQNEPTKTNVIVGVVDASGAPVERKMELWLRAEEINFERDFYRLATTNDDGVFSFENIEPGSYRVDAFQRTEGAVSHFGTESFRIEGETTKTVAIKPSDLRGNSLGVHVDQDPNSISRQIVYLSYGTGLACWSIPRLYPPDSRVVSRVIGKSFVWAPVDASGNVTFHDVMSYEYSVGVIYEANSEGIRGFRIRGVGLKRKADQHVDIPYTPAEGVSRAPFDKLDTEVGFEPKSYKVQDFCDILSKATGDNPRFTADAELLKKPLLCLYFDGRWPISIWNWIERAYWGPQWRVDEAETKAGPPTLVFHKHNDGSEPTINLIDYEGTTNTPPAGLEQHIADGELFLRHKRYEAALGHFFRALRIAPDNERVQEGFNKAWIKTDVCTTGYTFLIKQMPSEAYERRDHILPGVTSPETIDGINKHVELDTGEMSFAAVLAWMTKRTNVPIKVDEHAQGAAVNLANLDKLNVSHLKLKETTAEEALQWLCFPYGIDFVVRKDYIWITTPARVCAELDSAEKKE